MSDLSSNDEAVTSDDEDTFIGLGARRRRGRTQRSELSDEEDGLRAHYESLGEEGNAEFAPRRRGRLAKAKRPSSASHVKFVSGSKPSPSADPFESSASEARTNEDFRKLVEASTQETVTRPRKRPLTEASREIGEWERHTKGFGAKMLSKFGFSGRLGAREDGVSQAIEVAVRPTGAGLGFGGITEASALPSNKKIEAEWRGVEYSDVKLEDGAKRTQSWRKGKSRKELRRLSAVELLMQQADLESSEQVLSKKSEFAEASRSTVEREVEVIHRSAKPELGEELLYNLSTMLEAEEVEARALSSKLHSILRRSKAMRDEIASLSKKVDSDRDRVDRLEGVSVLVGKVKEQIESDPSAVSVESLCGVFLSLLDAFSEEFFVFGMINLVPLFARPLLSHQLNSWRPLDEPCFLLDLLKPWDGLEDVFNSHGKSNLGQQSHEMIVDTLKNLSLPVVRRALVTDWDLHRSNSSCALLIKSMQSVFSADAVNEIVDQSILPKLQRAVGNWVPDLSSTLHLAIQEWIPILGSKISFLFPDIRRKISHALSNWNGLDSLGLSLVKPWQGYFDEGSMLNLIFRVVIPKLITALRAFVINPQNQSIDTLVGVLSWHGVIPQLNLCALLAGEFFPKWLHILYLWLTTNPDFEEVSEWYAGWKSLFPDDIAEHNLVKSQFNIALDMMEASLSGAELQHPFEGRTGVQANSYLAIMERISSDEKTQQRLHELQKKISTHMKASSLASLKEVVEEFASDKGIEFTPQLGRYHDDKPIWKFGDRSIYFDQNVIFLYTNEGKIWKPIGLEDLAAIVDR